MPTMMMSEELEAADVIARLLDNLKPRHKTLFRRYNDPTGMSLVQKYEESSLIRPPGWPLIIFHNN
jgi:hypothetical protein